MTWADKFNWSSRVGLHEHPIKLFQLSLLSLLKHVLCIQTANEHQYGQTIVLLEKGSSPLSGMVGIYSPHTVSHIKNVLNENKW